MPRGPKPEGQAQAAQVANGLPYGDRQRLEEAQQQVPLPDNRGIPGQPAEPASPDFGALAGQAQALGGVPLTAGDDQPQTPVTDGSMLGPGAGPEAIATVRGPSPTQAVLDALAADGHPYFGQLAARQRQRVQGSPFPTADTGTRRVRGTPRLRGS